MLTVEAIYQQRRDKQTKDLELRRESIYKDHPDLEELRRQISLKQVQILRLKLADRSVKEREELDLYELKEARKRYMADYNIDEEDLKLHYYCENCKDWGYVVEDNVHKKCSCIMEIQESLRQGQAHLSKRMEKENFANFDIFIFDDKSKYEVDGGLRSITERENIIEIRDRAYSFIDNFAQTGSKNLVYYGGVGLGKSYMCYSIAKELIDRGYRVLYLTINELMDMMQLYNFDRDMFAERYKMEDYFAVDKADLLILDDLGTELTNSFVRTILFNIINSRMINNKKMIISTNLSPDELMTRYEERVSSRIIENTDFIKFFGENKRLE